MVFPLLPALAAGGLLAGKNYYQGNPGESSGMLDTLFGIDRTAEQKRARVGGVAATLAGSLPPDQQVVGNPQFDALMAGAQTGESSFINKQIDINAQQTAVALALKNAAEVKQSDRLYNESNDAAKLEREYARQDFTTLQQDYQADLKGFADLQQNWQGLRSALEFGTAQEAMTATIQIMKVLDPTSTVRTEEGQQVLAAEGAMASFANEFNRAIAGKGWKKETREAWFNAMRRNYAPKAQNAANRITWYGEEARRIKADPQRIIGRLGIDTGFGGLRDFSDRRREGAGLPERQPRLTQEEAVKQGFRFTNDPTGADVGVPQN